MASSRENPLLDPGYRPIGCYAVGIEEDSPVELEISISPDGLEVGDIVLIAGTDFVAAATRWLQCPHLFHREHRRWTHAALYIGSELIIEKHVSPFERWRIRNLREFAGDKDILVRRKKKPLSEAEKILLLSAGFAQLKAGYAHGKAFGFAIRSIAGNIKSIVRDTLRRWLKREVWPKEVQYNWIADDQMLCTDLIDKCHRAATRNYLIPQRYWGTVEYMLTPAALSWSPGLVDVVVQHTQRTSPVNA